MSYKITFLPNQLHISDFFQQKALAPHPEEITPSESLASAIPTLLKLFNEHIPNTFAPVEMQINGFFQFTFEVPEIAMEEEKNLEEEVKNGSLYGVALGDQNNKTATIHSSGRDGALKTVSAVGSTQLPAVTFS